MVRVAPKITIPDNLTRGQTMYHSLSVRILLNRSVRPDKLAISPIAHPLAFNEKILNIIFSVYETHEISWHNKATAIGHKNGAMYMDIFLKLFD